MDEFEKLLDRQFHLDLYSDMQLKDEQDAANFAEMVDYWDSAITEEIVKCIDKMNKRRCW